MNFKEGDQVPNDQLDRVFADISEAWEWVWMSSAEDDRRRAVEMLNVKREEGSCNVM